jgi:hypothetical protein
MANGYNLPARKLASQQDSAMIQRPDVPRSKFSGAFTRKTTFNAGLLIPFLVDEILPGDHVKYNVTAYVRMATPLFPLMDNQRIDTHFFFVPNRLVWQNWKRFMGEQATPNQSIDLTIPQAVVGYAGGGNVVGSLPDYFGLPVANISQAVSVSALPFRAYNLIYNEWFRDENLINSANQLVGDAVSNASDYGVAGMPFRRAKSQDYFTSALPWPQKFQAPTIPILGNAPVTGIGINQAWATTVYSPPGGASGWAESSGMPKTYNTYALPNNPDTLGIDVEAYGTNYRPKIFADMSQVTGVGINQLRQAFLTQQLLERDARGGTRYTEIVRSHFGVISPDARLQRPEYIGGGSSNLNVTPVAQTAPSADGVVGSLGAAGTAVGQHRASYASTEHGYVIGIMSVRSELSYNQGIPRTFSRQTRYDFYWPSLAGLGEQEILRKEIYSTGVVANDNAVFGYQERWHEYRTRYSEVTGRFRTNVAGTLAGWHLAQNFTNAPVLGQTFIEDTPPMSRVLAAGGTAATQTQEYLGDLLIQREAVRPIPMFGTPVTLGRF